MLLSERACKHPAASSQSSVTINQKKRGGEKNEAELEKGKEGRKGGSCELGGNKNTLIGESEIPHSSDLIRVKSHNWRLIKK